MYAASDSFAPSVVVEDCVVGAGVGTGCGATPVSITPAMAEVVNVSPNKDVATILLRDFIVNSSKVLVYLWSAISNSRQLPMVVDTLTSSSKKSTLLQGTLQECGKVVPT